MQKTALFLAAALSTTTSAGKLELADAAANAYAPYLRCVIENARRLSASAEKPSDIASAAVVLCESEKWKSYFSTLELQSDGEKMDQATADNQVAHAERYATDFASAVVVQSRAK